MVPLDQTKLASGAKFFYTKVFLFIKDHFYSLVLFFKSSYTTLMFQRNIFSVYNWRNLKISHIFEKNYYYFNSLEKRFRIKSNFFLQGAHIQARTLFFTFL